MSNLFPIARSNSFDRDFNNLINTFFGYVPTTGRTSRMNNVATTPRANIVRNDESFTIELAAPGFSRDEFDINVDNGMLSVHVGTSDTQEYNEKLTSQEYSYASFTRSWSLPKEVVAEAITARYDAGILYVTIPTNDKAATKLTVNVE